MENFEFSTVIRKVYVGMVWLWMAPRERERELKTTAEDDEQYLI